MIGLDIYSMLSLAVYIIGIVISYKMLHSSGECIWNESINVTFSIEKQYFKLKVSLLQFTAFHKI